MRKNKLHYCPIDEMETPCRRRYADLNVRTTPLPDLRSISCKICAKHIRKSREKHVYIP